MHICVLYGHICVYPLYVHACICKHGHVFVYVYIDLCRVVHTYECISLDFFYFCVVNMFISLNISIQDYIHDLRCFQDVQPPTNKYKSE